MSLISRLADVLTISLTWLLVLFVCCSAQNVSDSKEVVRRTRPNFQHSPQYIVTKKLLEGYSKQHPPTKDKATEVRLGIYVNSFYSISEQTMDYSVILYLRQSWIDPRLRFAPPDGVLNEMRMDMNYWQKIWVPDVFFRNEKKASYHDITVPNRLLKINSTGAIWYTIKISAILSCQMKLEKYPLDTQRCPMMLESFGYTTKVMYFSWLDNPVEVDEALQLPQFTLVEKLLHDCTENYTSGSFSCLSIEFVLHRDIGFFIIQVYVPSMLIVILSWVSFWINIDASPARVSLGLLTVLTTTTMSGGARASLPRVSYIKAIDIWMIVCLVFVFASLIEYSVVNVVSRRQVKPTPPPRPSRRRNRDRDIDSTTRPNLVRRVINRLRNRSKADGGGIEDTSPPPVARAPDPEASKRRARSVDKMSRKCFPLLFIVFNIIYWIAYTV